MANKQFSWNLRSPIAPSNFVMRAEPDKVFDSVVPVQMQLATTTDERHNFVRLAVELVPTGLSTSSFRKVRFYGNIGKFYGHATVVSHEH